MGKLLFIDSDDIETLSEALQGALERRGVVFRNNGSGEFDYPMTEDEEEDIDPYLGVMPHTPRKHRGTNDDSNWLFQESGGSRYNSGSCGSHAGGCGGRWAGGCGYTPSYGGCGGSRC